MEKTDYSNMSSKELKTLIDQYKKEIDDLKCILIDVIHKEHEEKYVTIKVEGCKGCILEHIDYSMSCEHCDGYHYEERLREKEKKK